MFYLKSIAMVFGIILTILLIVYFLFNVYPEKIRSDYDKEKKKELERKELHSKWEYVIEIDKDFHKTISIYKGYDQLLVTNSKEDALDPTSFFYFNEAMRPIREIRVYNSDNRLIKKFEPKHIPSELL